MAITMTESAAERVRRFIDKRGRGIGVRLGVRKTGCSGLAYVVDFADDVGEGDAVFETDGLKIVVAEDQLRFLDGTELDFARQGVNETFVFHNPNVRDECGCGESFNV